ncbi:MAG: undecaprenyl/decaprenyl-phosphate alpha-N-acetylglucosaminyl 1-phosphate transferase [Clostridia bacterium]|nr:MAG: undecaprenyl/decaprenyl-phosphate alpha-N-acetylglucosaminyl 1-phosphate transferase [Clostridia bacterium]
MSLTTTIVILVAGFVVVLLLTPTVRRLAVYLGAVDMPAARKVHRQPIPRLGGLAIYGGFLLVLLLSRPWAPPVTGLTLGSTLIVLVGIWDDCRELSAKVKLAAQVAAAVVVVVFGIRVDFFTNPFDGLIFLGALAAPVTVIWIVGITNALNLIDGLDGLAGGTAAIAAVTVAVVAWMEGQPTAAFYALALSLCALGFLRYNFFPAKIFMGDTGSMFLGFNLAILAIMGLTKTATIISFLVPVVILGWPIIDTFWAILRRYRNHQPIMAPDKQHLHHQLLNLGLSQRQAVLVVYILDGCLGACAILLNLLPPAQGILLLVVILAMVAVGCYLVRAASHHRVSSELTRQM